MSTAALTCHNGFRILDLSTEALGVDGRTHTEDEAEYKNIARDGDDAVHKLSHGFS